MIRSTTKPKILVLAPTPPPYAGPEVATQQFLDSESLQQRFNLLHLRSNLQSSNAEKGRPGLVVCLRLTRLCARTLSLLAWERPRVVYALLSQNKTGFLRDAILIWMARLVGRKVVVHFHGGNFRQFYIGQTRLMKILIRLTLRRISRVIVLANCLRSEFEGLVDADRVRVVYNGVPVPMRIEAKPISPTVTVLFLSSISVSKGAHLLIEAARRLSAQSAQFVFAGEKWQEEYNILTDRDGKPLPKYDFNAVEPDASLRFLPPVSGTDKDALFRKADIFVLTSYSEGFPLSVLEAMSYGLALIVTPVGALPEVLKEGENCLFVPTGSVDELTRALHELISRPDLKNKMAQANRRLASERFAAEQSAANLAGVFMESLESKTSPANRMNCINP